MKLRLAALASALLLSAAPPAAAADGSRARFSSFERISVSAGTGRSGARLVEAGTLVTDGARRIVLNLVGEIDGKTGESGPVGAVLVPVIPELAEAIRNRRGFPEASGISVALSAGEAGLFAAEQVELVVGFPRYRVFLWNESDATMKISVFAYLTE